MKKLIIAASAALCATVGFSDVTSANIVGYMNNATVRSYHKMIAPGFSMVSEDGTFGLADLKAAGYSPSTKNASNVWSGGCVAGQFEVKKLKQDGTIDGDYYYIDAKSGKEGTAAFKEYPAGWYTKSGTTFTKIEDAELAEIAFSQGQQL